MGKRDQGKLVFYVGKRTDEGIIVRVETADLRYGTIQTRPLPHVGVRTSPASPVIYHSPSGFNIGYGGSGPADLALAILAHALQDRTFDRRRAWPLHQDFKWQFIATIDRDALSFRISQRDVLDWVAKQATTP